MRAYMRAKIGWLTWLFDWLMRGSAVVEATMTL